jgi:hypothetical protein
MDGLPELSPPLRESLARVDARGAAIDGVEMIVDEGARGGHDVVRHVEPEEGHFAAVTRLARCRPHRFDARTGAERPVPIDGHGRRDRHTQPRPRGRARAARAPDVRKRRHVVGHLESIADERLQARFLPVDLHAEGTPLERDRNAPASLARNGKHRVDGADRSGDRVLEQLGEQPDGDLERNADRREWRAGGHRRVG